MPILELRLRLIQIETATLSLHLKECWCKRLSLSESVWHGSGANSFNLLWPKIFFFRVCVCITLMNLILGLLLTFFSFYFNKKIKKFRKKKIVLYIFKMCNWGWPMKFTFHDCVPCLALMSFTFYTLLVCAMYLYCVSCLWFLITCSWFWSHIFLIVRTKKS